MSIFSGSPSRDTPVVLTKGLTKVFKDFWMRSRVRAVDHLDMEIYPGEVFGLLGPNGSGKSTTIKILLGLLHKTSGIVVVFSKPPSDVAVKQRIGVLPEESYLYPFLNAAETLDYYGKLFELGRRDRKRRTAELLDMVGLTAVAHRQVHEYSKGMQRRIGLAQALINDPELLILDEPTTGLDPIGANQVKDLIIELGRRGKTILLSSHVLSDVEDCVDRLIILYGGKKRAEGTCETLLTASDRTIIESDSLDEATVNDVDRVLRAHGTVIRRVARPRQRLDELFMHIVERAREEKLETSGAQHGGSTASFLLTDDEGESTGEELIDRLVSARTNSGGEATGHDHSASATEADSKDDSARVIASLVKDSHTEQEQAAADHVSDDSDSDSNGEPDRSVIESLLGPGGGAETKPRNPGGEAP